LHTSQSEKKTKRTTHSRKRTVKESTENRKSIDSVIVSDEGKAERKKVLKVRRPILTASTNERTDNGIEKDVGLTTAEETISTKIDLIDQREDPEEGELSQSSKSEESESDENSSNNSSNDTNNHVEHDEQYPPCIRAIITESSSEEIKTGSLYLVTCMGGTIGREGNEHALTLPDSLVEKVSNCQSEDVKSKNHFVITFYNIHVVSLMVYRLMLKYILLTILLQRILQKNISLLTLVVDMELF